MIPGVMNPANSGLLDQSEEPQPAPPAPFIPDVEEAPKAIDLADKIPGADNEADRSSLGIRISRAITIGIQQKGSLRERIRVNEEFYENRIRKPSALPWPDAPWFHIPLVKPRLSQRAAALRATILAHDPVFRFKGVGTGQSNDAIEHDVQFVLEAQGWEQDLRRFTKLAMMTNTPVIRVTFQEHPNGLEKATHTGPFALPVIDVIHPDYMSIFPATPGPLDKKRICAHVTELRLAEVRAKQENGYFLDDVEVVGRDTRYRVSNPKEGDRQDPGAQGDEDEDANINIWDGIWLDDLDHSGKEKHYRVLVRVETQHLLRIEEYPIGIPVWYAVGCIDPEEGVLWTEGSPAQDLQALQIAMNSTFNGFYWLMQRISGPSLVTENIGGDLGDTQSLPPSSIVPVKSLGKSQVIQAGGDNQVAPAMMQIIEKFADSSGKVSDTLTGAPASNDRATATEENIKYTGFQISGSEDVAALSTALCRVAKLIIAQLAKYWDRVIAVYGPNAANAMIVQDPAVFRQAWTVEISGKEADDAPQIQLQQNQMLLQLATQIPDSGLPIAELLKGIVMSTTLENKEDIIREIDKAAQQMGTANALQVMAAMAQAHSAAQTMQQQGQPATDENGLAKIFSVLGNALHPGTFGAGAEGGSSTDPGSEPA